MTHGLTGGHHFKILAKIADDVFDKQFLTKMKQCCENKLPVDLRQEIIKIFESIITMFLLERDISKDMIPQNVVQDDSSIVKVDLPFFEGLNNAMSTGITSATARAIFGDRPVT